MKKRPISEATVLTTLKDNILLVTLNRPEARNALNDQISAAIFAKACFGHPSPIKRQKLRGS